MQNISQKRNIGPQVSSKNTDKTIMTQLSDKDHQAQMEDMKSFDEQMLAKNHFRSFLPFRGTK